MLLTAKTRESVCARLTNTLQKQNKTKKNGRPPDWVAIHKMTANARQRKVLTTTHTSFFVHILFFLSLEILMHAVNYTLLRAVQGKSGSLSFSALPTLIRTWKFHVSLGWHPLSVFFFFFVFYHFHVCCCALPILPVHLLLTNM